MLKALIHSIPEKYRPFTVGFFILFLTVFISVEALDTDDYWIYISGARDLFLGKNIYAEKYNEWYHYLYSVFFAIVLYPLSVIPYYPSKIIWLLMNLFFTWRIFVILLSYFDLEGLQPKPRKWFLIICVLFCIRFINDNFHCGQVTMFLLYLSLQGLELIYNKRVVWGALMIAFGINIKLMPVVLVPYLLYRKQFSASFLIIFFCSVMWLIPSLVIGHERHVMLLGSWWQLMNPNNTEHIIDTVDRGFHGLSTFFAVYLYDVTPNAYGYGTRINIASLTVEELKMTINAARVILVGCTLFFLHTLPFRNANGKLHRLYEVSYILAIIPLIFPHQQFYAYLLQLPAAICILWYLFNCYRSFGKWKRLVWTSMLSGIFLCFNLQLLLGEFTKFYEHFKLITFGGLAMLVLLYLSGPFFRTALPSPEKRS